MKRNLDCLRDGWTPTRRFRRVNGFSRSLRRGNAGQIPCESQSKTKATRPHVAAQPRDNLA